MNKSVKVFQMGQSLWYDNIQRKLLRNGELETMITSGKIYGVTSNPSIFHNAISNSNDYDDVLIPMAKEGRTAIEIFEAMAIEDIQQACDLFTDLYESTKGGDGYVSLEVSPELANETAATVEDAERLWVLVDRPNLMIKIPATKAGIPAVREAIAAGINVNVTLIFSQDRYEQVMNAYLLGLEDRVQAGKPVDHIASVASFFVSRIDSKIDGLLEEKVAGGEINNELASELMGRAAIANAKLAYQKFKDVFGSDRFSVLKEKGAKIQRPLWASTSTKNPQYPDVLYVESLIGEDTVNTVPPKTLEAFLEHGTAEKTLESNILGEEQLLADLGKIGVSMILVTEELEIAGVAAFSKAFRSMLEAIETKSMSFLD